MKSDPALRDVMTFEEGDERYSMYYLQPRTQEDLRRRNRAHRKIADFCFGLMGRTPDAFAGNLTGLSMKPQVFDSEPGGNSNNLRAIYQHVRRNDLFATYGPIAYAEPMNDDKATVNPQRLCINRHDYAYRLLRVVSSRTQSNVRFTRQSGLSDAAWFFRNVPNTDASTATKWGRLNEAISHCTELHPERRVGGD